MLHQLLQRVELSPGGDVVAAAVQLADLIMLDVVALHIIPVPYGQGEGTWGGVRWGLEVSNKQLLHQADVNRLSPLILAVTQLGECECVSGFTLRGFTLPDEVSAPRVACGQQLSLRILPAEFTKVPAAIRGQTC